MPSNPLPEPNEGITDPVPMEYGISSGPASGAPLEPVPPSPGAAMFPAWSWWDVLAVLGFTIFAVFLFSLAALAIARTIPAYKRIPVADLATDPRIVVGAQAAAYPVILVLIFIVVRSRTHQRFRDAIHWRWPGISAPVFFLAGTILALVVEGLSSFLPMPKSLPMDNYFHNASSAYLLAAFGITLAPLLEEVFFRGMLYPLLRRGFGLTIAVLLTAAAFAAIHGAQLGYAWSPILSIFIVGVAFTVNRARTNSVASSFLMHCGYNSALFTALWIASDHFRHLEKVTG
jgi:membrane protease YdiL (CAAX protease family)